jgi:hypothetical protein
MAETQGTAQPTPLNRILHHSLFKVELNKTLDATLQTLANPETSSAQHLALLLQQNQAYGHFLLKTDVIKKRKKGGMEETDSKGENQRLIEEEIPRAVLLLGKNATRNAITCMRMARTLGEGLPKKEDDTVALDASKWLRRALWIDEFSSENRLAHASNNFGAALLHDWLTLLAGANKETPKPAIQLLDDMWRESFRRAQAAYHLGAALKTFQYQSYAFGAGLCLGLGKYLMALQYTAQPSWIEFITNTQKRELPENSLEWLMEERKTFPVAHHEMAGLLFGFYPPLQAVEKAAHYYREPYYLRAVDPDLFKLSVILAIANRMCTLGPDQRKVIKAIGPFLGRDLARWTLDIGLSDKAIIQVAQAIKEA